MKNKLHHDLVRERFTLISRINNEECFRNHKKINELQKKLSKINKDIKNCIRNYNNEHKTDNISIIIKEIRASKNRQFGSNRLFYVGGYEINYDSSYSDVILSFVPERYWNMNHELYSKGLQNNNTVNNSIYYLNNFNNLFYIVWRKYFDIGLLSKEYFKWNCDISDIIKNLIQTKIVIEIGLEKDWFIKFNYIKSSDIQRYLIYNIICRNPKYCIVNSRTSRIIGTEEKTSIYMRDYSTDIKLSVVAEDLKNILRQLNVEIIWETKGIK